MFEEGMIIKTFPDTDVHPYVRMIRENGYSCSVHKGYIKVGKRKKTFDIDKKELAERIRKARKEKKLTRLQLAKKIGVEQCTVYDWELGRRVPRQYNMEELRRVLDI